MTLTDFRINHSTLIEHYQFMEAHLEGIYAAVSGKKLLDGLKDVDRDGLNSIVREIKTVEKRKRITVFTHEEHEKLRKIFQRRNFWCHQCYYDLTFDSKTGNLKHEKDIQAMLCDLQDAQWARGFLFDRKMELFHNHSKSLLPDVWH